MAYDYEKSLREKENLINTLRENGVFEKVSIKNVKTNVGHDLGGYYVDFYLKGHGKIGFVNNDGWGGEVLPDYESKEKQSIFENFLKENNVAQIMFDNGWAFMKDVNKIDFDCQTESLMELLIAELETKKYFKEIKKITKNAILFGNEDGYSGVKFRLSLKEIATKPNGLATLQSRYDEIKKKLKPGERILNENLKKLGIKL